MTTDDQRVLRLDESEDLLRMARRTPRNREDELFALLASKVEEAVVRDLAVLSDEVDLDLWLPLDGLRGPISRVRSVPRVAPRLTACCLPVRRD